MKYRVQSKSMLLLLPLLAACSGEDAGTRATTPQLDTAVAAQGVGQGSAKPAAGFDEWAKRLMADRISPVVAQPGDLSQTWAGADGRPVNVVVRVPRTAGKPTVSIQPPAAGANATPVFQAAIAQLKKAGGGVLKVAPGEYRFQTPNSDQPSTGHLLLSKVSDIDIQAANAHFVFETDADGIFIQDCQRVRIWGARMRDARTLSGTGHMRRVDGVLRLELEQPLPDGATINWVQPMNEGATRSWPQIQSRAIIAPKVAQPARLDERTFTSPEFKYLKDGQYVVVKFSYYGGRAVYVRDSFTGTSEDIVLDGVRIGSNGGMGVLVKSRGRGIAIQNSAIAADAGRPYSTNYDGIHVIAGAGDILIRGNSFAHTGDDQINLRSIIHKVTPVSADSATLTTDARLIRAGDEVAFFNKAGDYIGRRLVNAAPPLGNSDTLTFGFAKGDAIAEAAFARVVNITPRRYAIVNNTLADSAGRGMLLQIPNGLVQKNVIRGLPRTAIRLLTSFDPWYEGAGAINVRITGNTIDGGGAELGFSWLTGIITALGEVVSAKPAATMQNGPLKIDNNVFTAPRAACIAVYSTKDVKQENNICGA
jgi:hypothetical protein